MNKIFAATVAMLFIGGATAVAVYGYENDWLPSFGGASSSPTAAQSDPRADIASALGVPLAVDALDSDTFAEATAELEKLDGFLAAVPVTTAGKTVLHVVLSERAPPGLAGTLSNGWQVVVHDRIQPAALQGGLPAQLDTLEFVESGIGPGSALRITYPGAAGPLYCTASFLFADKAGQAWLGTAGHCLVSGKSLSSQAGAILPTGIEVCYDQCFMNMDELLAGAGVPIPAADWYTVPVVDATTIHAIRDNPALPADSGIGYDFGVFKLGLAASDPQLRNELPVLSGHDGVAPLASLEGPSLFGHFGHGTYCCGAPVGGTASHTPVDQARIAVSLTGAGIADQEGAFVALGWASAGDSGSAVETWDPAGALDVDDSAEPPTATPTGKGGGIAAAGTMTHSIIIAGLPLFWGTPLARGMALLETHTGFATGSSVLGASGSALVNPPAPLGADAEVGADPNSYSGFVGAPVDIVGGALNAQGTVSCSWSVTGVPSTGAVGSVANPSACTTTFTGDTSTNPEAPTASWGIYTLTLTVNDGVGSPATSTAEVHLVNDCLPEITINDPTDGATVGGTITVKGDVSCIKVDNNPVSAIPCPNVDLSPLKAYDPSGEDPTDPEGPDFVSPLFSILDRALCLVLGDSDADLEDSDFDMTLKALSSCIALVNYWADVAGLDTSPLPDGPPTASPNPPSWDPTGTDDPPGTDEALDCTIDTLNAAIEIGLTPVQLCQDGDGNTISIGFNSLAGCGIVSSDFDPLFDVIDSLPVPASGSSFGSPAAAGPPAQSGCPDDVCLYVDDDTVPAKTAAIVWAGAQAETGTWATTLDTSLFDNGQHTLQVELDDLLDGVHDAAYSIVINIDNCYGPEISILDPSTNEELNGLVTFSGTTKVHDGSCANTLSFSAGSPQSTTNYNTDLVASSSVAGDPPFSCSWQVISKEAGAPDLVLVPNADPCTGVTGDAPAAGSEDPHPAGEYIIGFNVQDANEYGTGSVKFTFPPAVVGPTPPPAPCDQLDDGDPLVPLCVALVNANVADLQALVCAEIDPMGATPVCGGTVTPPSCETQFEPAFCAAVTGADLDTYCAGAPPPPPAVEGITCTVYGIPGGVPASSNSFDWSFLASPAAAGSPPSSTLCANDVCVYVDSTSNVVASVDLDATGAWETEEFDTIALSEGIHQLIAEWDETGDGRPDVADVVAFNVVCTPSAVLITSPDIIDPTTGNEVPVEADFRFGGTAFRGTCVDLEPAEKLPEEKFQDGVTSFSDCVSAALAVAADDPPGAVAELPACAELLPALVDALLELIPAECMDSLSAGEPDAAACQTIVPPAQCIVEEIIVGGQAAHCGDRYAAIDALLDELGISGPPGTAGQAAFFDCVANPIGCYTKQASAGSVKLHSGTDCAKELCLYLNGELLEAIDVVDDPAQTHAGYVVWEATADSEVFDLGTGDFVALAEYAQPGGYGPRMHAAFELPFEIAIPVLEAVITTDADAIVGKDHPIVGSAVRGTTAVDVTCQWSSSTLDIDDINSCTTTVEVPNENSHGLTLRVIDGVGEVATVSQIIQGNDGLRADFANVRGEPDEDLDLVGFARIGSTTENGATCAWTTTSAGEIDDAAACETTVSYNRPGNFEITLTVTATVGGVAESATHRGFAIVFIENADTDNDGVLDDVDNCPTVANAPATGASQLDRDGDGQGDACDDDQDGDAILNVHDNCPTIPNRNQRDMDKDADLTETEPQRKGGDLCDEDKDGDGVDDKVFEADGTTSPKVGGDNCPSLHNPDQADLDKDGLGDACDDDIDGDGCPNARDAFPRDAKECSDADGDGIGDEADDDDNGNGIADKDEVRSNSNPLRQDSDALGEEQPVFDDADQKDAPGLGLWVLLLMLGAAVVLRRK